MSRDPTSGGTPSPVEPTPRWVVIGAGATAVVAALLFSSQIYFSMLDHGHDYWRLFLWQISAWGFWAIAAYRVTTLGGRLLDPGDRPRLWPLRLAVVAAALVGLHVLVVGVAFFLVQPYVPVATYTFELSLQRIWAASAKADVVIFGALVALGYELAGSARARRLELRESRLETELAKAQLEALRLEIQPHFLFNTLNSIAAQIRAGENDDALDMLLRLSELLRETLDHDGGAMVPLRDEIAFLERYLELQSVRFSDRLEVAYEIDPACEHAAVPFLLLQPLAENAIRHGIGRKAGAGRIEIGARAIDDRLVVRIADDGPGLPEDFDLNRSPGVGLANTRSKLDRLYPDGRAAFEIRDRAAAGTVALVTLPLELSKSRPEPSDTAVA